MTKKPKQDLPFIVEQLAKSKNTFEAVKKVLNRIKGYVKNARKKVKIDRIEASIFECNDCGTCCDYGVVEFSCSIIPADIMRWLKDDFGVLLVSFGIALTKDDEGFADYILKMNSKYLYENKKMLYSQEYVNIMQGINPSLLKVLPDEINQCVFYDSTNFKCSIHEHRPISCRVYPYTLSGGVVRLDNPYEMCNPACWKEGKLDDDEVTNGLMEIIASKRGLELFKKSRMKGNVVEYRTMYNWFLNTFFLLYPELINVENVMKRIKGDA
jgi:Fe-S-cluster containining protein